MDTRYRVGLQPERRGGSATERIAPSADALYRQRMANLGVDDSSAVGCLPSGPRLILGSGAGPQLVKIEQKEHVILVRSELLRYRQIFMDGRTLPTDPSPSFMGYSVGHWEGETLVVESNGFNDRSWLDSGGHPHTEALRITERFTRTSMGRMELQVTLSDPDLYKRPLIIPVSVTLAPDTELLEFVCNEQENRRMAIGMTDAEKSIRVDPSVLRNLVGTYQTDATNRPVRRYTVRMDQDRLVVDLDGRGSIPMVPLSRILVLDPLHRDGVRARHSGEGDAHEEHGEWKPLGEGGVGPGIDRPQSNTKLLEYIGNENEKVGNTW